MQERKEIDDESTNVHLLGNVGSGHGRRGWHELENFSISGSLDMAYKFQATDILSL